MPTKAAPPIDHRLRGRDRAGPYRLGTLRGTVLHPGLGGREGGAGSHMKRRISFIGYLYIEKWGLRSPRRG